jgi:hypothetical protein
VTSVPGGTQPPAATQRRAIEGVDRPTIEPRLARADGLIYLDLTRRIFVPRMLWRTVIPLGRERDDRGSGKKDRIELPYMQWFWNHDRDQRARKTAELTIYATRVPVIWLASTRDVRTLRQVIHACARPLSTP